MATRKVNIAFKNAQIDLEEGTITEYKKDEIKVYRLLDELAQFAGEDKYIDMTISETSEKTPIEED